MARAGEEGVSASDFGGVGLLQTRTARFGPDGQLDVGFSDIEPYKRYYLNFHILPWLEGTFRYSEITNRLFSRFPSFSGFQTFKDRGADVKVRLLTERKYRPALAVVLQDGLGTGIFQGEAVVASKRVYDLDFSLGMAWGNPGARGDFSNPLIRLSESFRARTAVGGPLGGNLNFGSYFSGERVALFGGVEYQTPFKGLSLKLEYEGNDYSNEPQGNAFVVDSPFNVGLNYRPFSWIDASAAVERGNTMMFRVSLRAGLHEPGLPKFDDPPVPLEPRREAKPAASVLAQPAIVANADTEITVSESVVFRSPGRGQRAHGVSTKVAQLFDRIEAEGIQVASIEFSLAAARIHTSDGRAMTDATAVQRALLLLGSAAVEVEGLTVIAGTDGRRTSLTREDIGQTLLLDYLFERLSADGSSVEEFELTHAEARIYLSGGPRDDIDASTAYAVLGALPRPVERVTLVRTRDGREIGRVTVGRDDPRSGAITATLFSGLEKKGFQIESLLLTRGRALVRLSTNAADEPAVLREAAVFAAEQLPDHEVTLVALRDNIEQSRLTVYRAGTAGRASGAEAASGDRRGAAMEPAAEIAARLFEELEANDFSVEAVYLEEQRVEVFVIPSKFREVARNLGRAARIVANSVPASVEVLTIVQLVGGIESSRVTIMREDLEKAVAYRGSPDEIWTRATIEAPRGDIPSGAIRNPGRYPGFGWGIAPRLRSHIGGPDQFYLYQFWVALTANLDLLPGLRLRGRAGVDLYNNFERIKLRSDSVLEHVRSDIKDYLQQGADNLAFLNVEYAAMPVPEWYGRLSAGLLEEMFGAYGAEILYRPYTSRWAFGADLFKARRRTFEQRFSFFDYTVKTGHVNLYYHLPRYNLLAVVHAGQYLAGDHGATLFLSRLFDSGIRVGAWATLTNVSPADFGEGSFDKGFFVSMPFELFLSQSSRAGGSLAFRPLYRDGGQILGGSKRLYDLTGEGTLENIAKDWHRLLD